MLLRQSLLFLLLIALSCASYTWIQDEDSLEVSDAMWNKKEPERAFPSVHFNTGYDIDGTPLFAARANILRGVDIGYVRKGATNAHFAVFSYEKTVKYFEVMVSATGHWEKQPDEQIPLNAIRVGSNRGAHIYLGRVYYKKGLFPAQVSSTTKKASFIYGGLQIDSSNYEILVSNWVKHLKGNKPENAFKFFRNYKTGDSLYLIRAHYRGRIYPGVLTNGEIGALIQTEKRALRVHEYEVLTGVYNLRDRHFIENEYPVILGQDTKKYYVCLGKVKGELIPGKLSTKKHSGCRVFQDGEVLRVRDFFYLEMCG